MCVQTLPAGVQHTTGTTGASLQLHRSAAEQAFIWEFFSAQLAARPVPTPRPLHLNLVNAYHGSLTPMPTAAFVLNAGVYDRAQASQARVLLDRTYSLEGVEPRISVVMGTERMLKALTVYLMDDGFDLAGSPVRTIALFGGHVTPNRKRLLSRLWQARVQDNYSLTEVFGGATECGIGGPWIFDPHVVAEVVHPRTFEPVTSGVGVLLLTTLYPFVQQMPLVRYCTNDLVEVVETGDQDGAPVVRYVGRVPRSILDVTRFGRRAAHPVGSSVRDRRGVPGHRRLATIPRPLRRSRTGAHRRSPLRRRLSAGQWRRPDHHPARTPLRAATVPGARGRDRHRHPHAGLPGAPGSRPTVHRRQRRTRGRRAACGRCRRLRLEVT